MTVDLLQRLCCSRLPLIVDSDAEISLCLLLSAEHLIDADLPPLRRVDGHGSIFAGHAIVMRVTEQGYARLQGATSTEGTARGL